MLRWRFWLVAMVLTACGGNSPLPMADAGSEDAAADVLPDVPDAALPDAATADAAVEVADTAPDVPPASDISATDVALATCPSAVIAIVEGNEVVPQTVLHLKGDGSTGANGKTIKKYLWTAKQPAGSNKGFSPSSAFPNPTFTPDAAGDYQFCLDVWDTSGTQSCKQTCAIVAVVPNNAVHVELLWDTPGDADQTDTGPAAGADLDLHFTHPLANQPDVDCDGAPDPWFDNPFDCFWFNNAPEWDSMNPAIGDNPTLDLDDTDGAGPENLNLESPAGTAQDPHAYSIGVHYWNDHKFGPSYATLTVYMFGTIALKVDTVALQPLDMWYVGKLNWPNQLTGTSTPPLNVCYQSGDTCSGKGKMWQPKGDWCITPCYRNKAFNALAGNPTSGNCP